MVLLRVSMTLIFSRAAPSTQKATMPHPEDETANFHTKVKLKKLYFMLVWYFMCGCVCLRALVCACVRAWFCVGGVYRFLRGEFAAGSADCWNRNIKSEVKSKPNCLYFSAMPHATKFENSNWDSNVFGKCSSKVFSTNYCWLSSFNPLPAPMLTDAII